MKITDLAISNRTAIVVLTLALSIGGLLSYVSLPKESQPQIEFAQIIITTIYPGASPDDVESIITQEVEREVATISGLDEVRSTSTEGVSTVIAEFFPDKDIDEASREVREAVDLAKTEFPSDVEEPIVSEIDFADFPVLTVNLLTEGSLTALRTTAEDLQDEIEGVPGVSGVDLLGGLEREVQVDIDLAALQGYNLSTGDVVAAIQSENTNIPGGSVDVGPENYLLRVNGEFDSPNEILDLVVKAPGGTPIYVRDVADVRFGYKDRTSYARLELLQRENEDGETVPVENAENLQVIRLNVKKASGENIIEVVDGVEAVIDGFNFPRGTEHVLTGDQSESVETLVEDLENNIIAGILFVIAVLLFFLGVRNATLVGLAIPLSMFLTFLVFSVMGQTLNFIILFSLIIALGMLVDNAIVIIENIYRFREEGYGPWEAAQKGTAEVGLAVAASTATTVAAFAPMLLWPGIIGKFMSYMPLTLIVTLTSSLFVALIINPVIAGYFIKTEAELSEEKAASGARGERNPRTRMVALGLVAFTALVVGIARWQTLIFLAVAIPALVLLYRNALAPAHQRFANRTVPRMTEAYRSFLAWMLKRDYTVRRGLLRNTFALGAFTGGFLLLIAGAALNAAAAPAGYLLMAPGGIALVVGILAILGHSLETAFLGGRDEPQGGALVRRHRRRPHRAAHALGQDRLLDRQGHRGGDRHARDPDRARRGGPPRRRQRLGRQDDELRLALHRPNGQPSAAADGHARHAHRRRRAVRHRADGRGVLPDDGPQPDPDHGRGAHRDDDRALQRSRRGGLRARAGPHRRGPGDGGQHGEHLHERRRRRRRDVRRRLRLVGALLGHAQPRGLCGPRRELLGDAQPDPPEPRWPARRRLQVTQDQGGPPTGAAVNIEVSGKEFDQIQAIANRLKAQLEDAADAGRIEGIVDIRDNLNSGRPEYRIEIDRERAAAFGLSTQKVALAVRGAVNGVEASKWRDGKDEYDITVRLREQDRENLRQIESLTILDEGQQIPLTAVANIVPASGLGSVTRLDQERVVTVLGDAAPGANANEVLAQVQAELAPVIAEVPEGYTISYTGANEEQNESFSFLTTALLMGLALITIILIAQFNSVKNPLIIMVAVGLSLIGVMLGLILTRTPFGLMTFIGLISLAGIVVNNAIVLVDYIEQLRDRGEDKQEAIIDGGATRLRPVLLTAFTTVIGLIPLTFGINIDFVGLMVNLDPSFSIGSENTQFWGPMGTAIISGLTFATFLTLVIVPVMYSAFDSLALRISAARGEAPEAHHGKAQTAGASGEFAPSGGGRERGHHAGRAARWRRGLWRCGAVAEPVPRRGARRVGRST